MNDGTFDRRSVVIGCVRRRFRGRACAAGKRVMTFRRTRFCREIGKRRLRAAAAKTGENMLQISNDYISAGDFHWTTSTSKRRSTTVYFFPRRNPIASNARNINTRGNDRERIRRERKTATGKNGRRFAKRFDFFSARGSCSEEVSSLESSSPRVRSTAKGLLAYPAKRVATATGYGHATVPFE